MKPAMTALPDCPPAACPVCGVPMPRPSKYGICSRTPECRRQRDRKRHQEPHRANQQRQSNLAWMRANRDKTAAQRERRRQRLRAAHLAWREANPSFIADWFEAPPAMRDDFLRRWAAAQPEHAGRLRHQEAAILRQSGEVTVLTPALAKLEAGGREPLYGMAGSACPRAAPYPGEGHGIGVKSWLEHAEGEVFAAAAAAGWSGGAAVLRLTHDPCAFCMNSFAGFARLLDLDSLTVRSASGPVGTYAAADGRFRPVSPHWWAGYARHLPGPERERMRRQPLAAPGPVLNAGQLTRDQRAEAAAQLRAEGHSLPVIGGVLGVDKTTIARDLGR